MVARVVVEEVHFDERTERVFSTCHRQQTELAWISNAYLWPSSKEIGRLLFDDRTGFLGNVGLHRYRCLLLSLSPDFSTLPLTHPMRSYRHIPRILDQHL